MPEPLETSGAPLPPGLEDRREMDVREIRRRFLILTVIFYGVGFLITALTAILVDAPRLEYLRGPLGSLETWVEAANLFGYGLAVGLGIVLAGYVAGRLVPTMADLEAELASYLFWVRGWGDAFLIASFSALAEEAFFRGLLQPWTGLVGTSLIFAAVHFPLNRRLALWPVFAVLMGLLLGWLYESTGGNLLAPTAVHFVVNFLNVRLLTRRSRT